jgi:hypothetical protein
MGRVASVDEASPDSVISGQCLYICLSSSALLVSSISLAHNCLMFMKDLSTVQTFNLLLYLHVLNDTAHNVRIKIQTSEQWQKEDSSTT